MARGVNTRRARNTIRDCAARPRDGGIAHPSGYHPTEFAKHKRDGSYRQLCVLFHHGARSPVLIRSGLDMTSQTDSMSPSATHFGSGAVGANWHCSNTNMSLGLTERSYASAVRGKTPCAGG